MIIKKNKELVNPANIQSSVYTKEHVDFIRANYTENRFVKRIELLELFNKHFNLNINILNLGFIINKYNLVRQHSGSGYSKFTPIVKLFIRKCVEKRMSSQECKDACERKFERPFNRNTISQVASKMGIAFITSRGERLDDFLKKYPKIENKIRRLIKKYPNSRWHDILIRDMIIEKYEKGVKTTEVRLFCLVKKIEINVIGRTLKQKSEKNNECSRRRYRMEKLEKGIPNIDNYDDGGPWCVW